MDVWYDIVIVGVGVVGIVVVLSLFVCDVLFDIVVIDFVDVYYY